MTTQRSNGQKPEMVVSPERLPYIPAIGERFGIDRASWRALIDAVFPNATSTESVVLALSYCRARKLDPFKRVVHIVPIWDKARKRMVETVWPGIGELRTTAFRTGHYAGREETIFGQEITEELGGQQITYPNWAQVTVWRTDSAGNRNAFVGPRVYWLETYATASRDTKAPNAMWAKRPYGQIDKCAEAAALRAAFPEETGDTMTDDEAEGIHAAIETRSLPTLQRQELRSEPTRSAIGDRMADMAAAAIQSGAFAVPESDESGLVERLQQEAEESRDAWLETPKTTPAETPKTTPAETPKTTPVETPSDKPVQANHYARMMSAINQVASLEELSDVEVEVTSLIDAGSFDKQEAAMLRAAMSRVMKAIGE